MTESKICTACNKLSSIENFHFRDRENDKRISICKVCKAKFDKEKYNKKVIKYLQLKNKPCADCLQTYPHYVMEFDHIKGIKVRTVASLLASTSWKKLLEEVDKCELVCANCHSIRTYKRRHNIEI